MKLFHFAHPKEASQFLTNNDYKTTSRQGVYEATDHILCISKEGLFNTMTMVSMLCEKYPIKHIHNFGVAGSLNSKLEIGSVYKISTIYQEDGFHSYQSIHQDDKNSLQCITAKSRVLEPKRAFDLSVHADLVDMELWAIAKVSHFFGISFESTKVISDNALIETRCFDVRESAEQFSKKLHDSYTENNSGLSTQNLEIKSHPNMSFTQSKMWQKIQKRIQNLGQKISFHDYFEDDNLSKKEISKILENLSIKAQEGSSLYNPKLNVLFKGLRASGAKIKTDPQLEKEYFDLSIKINSQANIDKLKKELSHFNYQDFIDFMHGDLDV